MRAVIIDIRGRYAAALTENGTVVRIRNREYEPGQGISFTKEGSRSLNVGLTGKLMAAAAAVVLLLTAGGVTAYAMPYGTVRVETTGSVEYTINCFDYVLDIRALDEEGDRLLAEMDASSVKHQRIDAAVVETLRRFQKEDEQEDHDIVIRSETKNSRHTEKLQERLDGMGSDQMEVQRNHLKF